MKPKITLLIHGAFSGNALPEIFAEYGKVPIEYKRRMEIILVSYIADEEKNKQEVLAAKLGENVRIVGVKDLFNPGFFNINRQITSVLAGLDSIPEDNFVIKLRNDQWISFTKLFKVLEKNDFFEKEEGRRILTTNCYTRKDRLYHPSDMFLCGMRNELYEYYNCPLMEETHLNFQLYLNQKCREKEENFEVFFACPEMILFKNYIKNKGWTILNTFEDSFNALNKYCYIANSWDIGFRWKKQRNPYLKSGSIVLPYYFDMAPFKGAPVEKARCYMRHDFGGKMTVKDAYYIGVSKILHYFKYFMGRQINILLFRLAASIRNNTKLMFLLRHSPFWKLAIYMSRKCHLS